MTQKGPISRLARLAIFAGFGLLTAAPAVASSITWSLHNLAFNSGSTVSGSFAFDEGSITNVNMTLDFTLGSVGSCNGNFGGCSGFNISGNVPLDFTGINGSGAVVFTSSLGPGSEIQLMLEAPALESFLAKPQVINLAAGNTILFWDINSGGSDSAGSFGPGNFGFTLSDFIVTGELAGVGPPPSITPEPAPWALLGTGALVLLGFAARWNAGPRRGSASASV